MTAPIVITRWLLETVLMYGIETSLLSDFFLALTPLERLYALRHLSSNAITEQWFVIGGIAAIIALALLYIIISYNRRMREQYTTYEIFNQNADRCGFSERERQLLFLTARLGGIKRCESIFTMSKVFDLGAEKMIENSLIQHGAEPSRQIRAELSYIREKLGFKKNPVSSIGALKNPQKGSSRQIPVDKSIYITRRRAPDLDNELEAKVIANTNLQLLIKLAFAVETVPGDLWRARYYLGASVWEFDTSIIDCDGEILILNHSDNIRFINRRRFLRAEVNKQAYITIYTFSNNVPLDQDHAAVADTEHWLQWKAPEFVKGVITELAGPGLRIEAPLEVKTNDRVLVLFRLDDEEPLKTEDRHNNKSEACIIQDIGVVKHVNKAENGYGWSIAVELIGLSDSDLNILIRATNEESVKRTSKVLENSGSTEIKETVITTAEQKGD